MSHDMEDGYEPEGTRGFVQLLGLAAIPIILTILIAVLATR